MRNEARLSADRLHRYWLLREWDYGLPVIAFIGLNPSTADETADDPTIRKCIKYAKAWGFGSLLMLNIYSFRATDPKEMWKARERGIDIIGIHGNTFENLAGYMQTFCVQRCIAAWGKGKQEIRGHMAKCLLERLECLNLNKDGSPAHPLYQRDDAQPKPWNLKQ
jgi:hypothetical protein